MNETTPTFLMVGAAKSGTTSIYQHLREHPEVFMPEDKEPNFFVREVHSMHPQEEQVSTREAYLALYANTERFLARGDGCVHNLYYHPVAIPEIRKLLGDIKIIIALRNPVDRAWSQFNSMSSDRRFDSFEACLDFEGSGSFESYRSSEGSSDPAQSTEADIVVPAWIDRNYLYVSWSLYCEQVKAYVDNFSDVEIVLFEDLRNDATSTMARLYRFIGVDDRYTPNLGESYNVSITPRNSFVWQLMDLYKRLHIGDLLTSALTPIIGADRALRSKARLFKAVAPFVSTKPVMRPETRARLKDQFRTDVLELQTLINRDLSSWI